MIEREGYMLRRKIFTTPLDAANRRTVSSMYRVNVGLALEKRVVKILMDTDHSRICLLTGKYNLLLNRRLINPSFTEPQLDQAGRTFNPIISRQSIGDVISRHTAELYRRLQEVKGYRKYCNPGHIAELNTGRSKAQ